MPRDIGETRRDLGYPLYMLSRVPPGHRTDGCWNYVKLADGSQWHCGAVFMAIAPFPMKNNPRERMMSLGVPSAIRKAGAGSAPAGLEIPLGFAQFEGIRAQRGRFGSGTRSSGLWRLRGTCVLLRRLRRDKFFCNLRRFPAAPFRDVVLVSIH